MQISLLIYSIALLALLYSNTYVWKTYWMYLKINKKTERSLLSLLWTNAFLILVVFSNILFEFIENQTIKTISDVFLLLASLSTVLLAREIQKGPYKTLKMLTKQR